MVEGEYESLKAIYATSPDFCPKPYCWGKCAKDDDMYFLLEEFRHIQVQPATPEELADGLAGMHNKSKSPTGKFGFHVSTTHAKIRQPVAWEDSWCTLYTRHLSNVLEMAYPLLKRPDLEVVGRLTLEKVVPRLLLPLQAEGRTLKPSLIHGDCWDGNTALEVGTKKAFIFDVCSFYGHNEYDTGNWRAKRHKLCRPEYMAAYHARIPPSEPRKSAQSFLCYCLLKIVRGRLGGS